MTEKSEIPRADERDSTTLPPVDTEAQRAKFVALVEAGQRHADGLTAQLAKPEWRPSRAHAEQARNSIKKLADILQNLAAAPKASDAPSELNYPESPPDAGGVREAWTPAEYWEYVGRNPRLSAVAAIGHDVAMTSRVCREDDTAEGFGARKGTRAEQERSRANVGLPPRSGK